jgi:hypothetical protein
MGVERPACGRRQGVVEERRRSDERRAQVAEPGPGALPLEISRYMRSQ